MPSVSAESASGRYDAMARYVRTLAISHDVSDGSGCSGPTGQRGDVAIRGYTSPGNSSDDCQDLRRERYLWHLVY